MALPTSTIVMAVVTCIPFGLAIKDTVTGKDTKAHRDRDEWESRDDDSDSDSAYDDAEYARAEAIRAAEEAQEAAEEERKEKEAIAARRSLFGAEVATLGSGFETIRLGMPEVEVRETGVSALERSTGMDISLLANGTLDWISVSFDPNEDEYSACLKLKQDLKSAWGNGTSEDYSSLYWVNPTTKTRASLNPDNDCRLSFERYAAPKDWITKTPASIVPVALVGQSIAKLKEHVGARSEVDEEAPSVRWLGLGVGAGSGEARFEAFYAKGKVVALTVTTDTLEVTRDEVREQLTALYGKPVEDEEGGYRWKARPGISLDSFEGAGVRVTVGTVPVEE